jgi:hypothetical protein
MPTPRRPDPEPLEADDVAIVTAGTVLWALALLASLIFHDRLANGGNENWTWIFLAGTFLGLMGVRYVRRRRAALRRGTSNLDEVGPSSEG